MRSDNPHRHDGFDRLFDGQLGREYLLFREKEEKALRWDKGCGDKNGDLRLALEISQLICHKADHIISFLWEFNKDSLSERAFSRGREGIGQLF